MSGKQKERDAQYVKGRNCIQMSIFTHHLPLNLTAYWYFQTSKRYSLISPRHRSNHRTQCPPKLRYAVSQLFIFHALTFGKRQTSCGYSFSFEMQVAPLSGSLINLHRIVSIKSLSLWLDWDASAAACNQLPPNLGPNRRVAVCEQQI